MGATPTQDEATAFCAHCCSLTTQRLVHVQKYRDLLLNWDNSVSESNVQFCYFVAVCQSCRQILLYHEVDDVPKDAFARCELRYPRSGLLDMSVPMPVRKTYAQAYRIRSSASGYAALIRKALEQISTDRNADGRTLRDKLQALEARGEFPPTLLDMTHAIRIFGNDGVHTDDVKAEHIPVIDDFFRAVVDYVYVGPSKIAEYRKRIGK